MDLKNPFDLTGKIAWINGASRGIGAATARILSYHGAHVICTSRKLDSVEAVAAAIQAGGSDEARAAMRAHLIQSQKRFQTLTLQEV